MKRSIFVWFAAALALSLSPASAQEVGAQAAPPPTITVDGSASASLTPDTTIISLGVVTTRPKAVEAAAENSKALARALTSIKADGIPDSAVTTTALKIEPVYTSPNAPDTLIAFHAVNGITVRVPMTLDAGKLTAMLVDDGVNQLTGVGFTSDQEAATRDRLRSEAAKNARHDAEIYAEALGLRLGRVLTIKPEQPSYPGGFEVQGAMVPRYASPALSIRSGQITLTERVSVTFELVQ